MCAAPSAAALSEVVPAALRLGLDFAAGADFRSGLRDTLRGLSVNGVRSSQHVEPPMPLHPLHDIHAQLSSSERKPE